VTSGRIAAARSREADTIRHGREQHRQFERLAVSPLEKVVHDREPVDVSHCPSEQRRSNPMKHLRPTRLETLAVVAALAVVAGRPES